MKRCTLQQGLSLIELLVASALSLLVVAGATSSYIAGQQASHAAEQRIAMQQDARMALAALANDLRQAGVFGCAIPALANRDAASSDAFPWRQHYPDHDASSSFDRDALGVRVMPAAGADWLADTGLTPLSDLLIVQFGQGNAQPIAIQARADGDNAQLSTLTVRVSADQSFPANSTLLALASCHRLDLLRAGVSHQQSASPTGLTLALAADTAISIASGGNAGHHAASLELMRFVSRAYVVGRRHGQTALYLLEIGADGRKTEPLEIAANVTGLTAQFGTVHGCDKNGAELSMSYHNQPADWRQVDAVRLTLSMQAPAALDREQHSRTYHSTVAIRGSHLCGQRAAG